MSNGAWFYCRSCNILTSNPAEHDNSCRRKSDKPLRPVTFSGRECPQCYLGLKGKRSCPICGNTKEPPLDEFGRRIFFSVPDLSSTDHTAAMSRPASSRFERGTTYNVNVGSKREPKFRQWKCIDVNGPMVMFADPEGKAPHVLHMTSIADFEPIGDENDEWVDDAIEGEEVDDITELEQEVRKLLGGE